MSSNKPTMATVKPYKRPGTSGSGHISKHTSTFAANKGRVLEMLYLAFRESNWSRFSQRKRESASDRTR